MLITVDRFLSTDEATLSRISVDGVFCCYGLEDQPQAVKVPDETRIPAGDYKVGLRRVGSFHIKYSADARFKDFHKGMLHVLAVPGFENILIHVGNDDDDTSGCLLVGMEADLKRMRVLRSADAYKKLYLKVIDAARADELIIKLIDNDVPEREKP